MELSQETFNEIHRYLSGQGTPEERADFAKRLQTDESLARAVDTERRIRDGLKANENRKLFRDIHAQLQSEGALAFENTPDNQDDRNITTLQPAAGPQTTRRWPYIAAAASVLLAMGLIWYANDEPKPAQVASKTTITDQPATPDTTPQAKPAEQPAPSKTVTPAPKRLETPAPAVPETDLFTQYFKADTQFESPFPKDKLGISPAAFRQWRSDTARVNQGVRHLAQREAALALPELQQVENSSFRQVKNAAEWYIALAYLQQNDRKSCEEQLKKVISNTESTYSPQAVELLAKIR